MKQIFLAERRQTPHEAVDAQVRMLTHGDDGSEECHIHEEPARKLFRYGDSGIETVAQHHIAKHQNHHQCKAKHDEELQQMKVAFNDLAHRSPDVTSGRGSMEIDHQSSGHRKDARERCEPKQRRRVRSDQ